jgi:L-fuculose-phosphate aldolase
MKIKASPSSPMHPADQLASIMERIYRYRMTTTSGGNLSIRDEAGSLWITPSQTDKGNLRPRDIVCVNPDGAVKGRHKPSSEYPFHQLIYAARPDLRAIVHAHPVALVAFSICGERPNTQAFNRSRVVCGEAGFASYALPGSLELGRNIAAEFARGFNCVMLENHGVVVGGSNLQEAFERFETLEFTARIILKAKVLGGKIQYLTPSQLELAKNQEIDFPTFVPSFIDAREKNLRQELCQFVQRGYRQRLLTAAQGSYSARLDPSRFVITPWEVDRADIKPSDLVLVKKGWQEVDRAASRSLPLHAAIYKRHPEINSIILATPPNATAFSITHQALDSRTIPESYIFLRDVQRIPFTWVYGNGDEVAAVLSSFSPTAILENSGVLVTGKSILAAFDRLEVLESTADALINALTLGSVHPMSPEAILDLEKEFLS